MFSFTRDIAGPDRALRIAAVAIEKLGQEDF
jgi:hypothetical protein